MTSLAQLGDGALPALRASLARPGTTGVERHRLVRIIGRLRTPSSIAALLAELDQAEVELAAAFVKALVHSRYRATATELPAWEARLRLEAVEAAHCCAAIRDFAGTAGAERLVAALRTEIARCREQVLDILSFIAPQQILLDAKRRLNSAMPSVRATAIELLDTILPASIKREVFPLIDDSNAEQQALKLLAQFPAEPKAIADWLVTLLNRKPEVASAWTKACVLEFLARKQMPASAQLRQALLAAIDEPRPLVRETALWCLASLEKVVGAADLRSCVEARQHDPDPVVAAMARQTLAALQEKQTC